jgi:hypothetical protein
MLTNFYQIENSQTTFFCEESSLGRTPYKAKSRASAHISSVFFSTFCNLLDATDVARALDVYACLVG